MDKKIDAKAKALARRREKVIEMKLVDMVEKHGGACLKFVSPGSMGVPDRQCLLPGGQHWYVETKTKGGKLEPWQIAVHHLLEKLGFQVRVIWNEVQLKHFENEIRTA